MPSLDTLGSVLSFNQGTQLVARLERGGLTPEHGQRLLQDNTLVERWVAALAALLTSAVLAFKLIIDYGRSLEEMIEDGGYDYVHPEIRNKFKIKGTGQEEREIVLVHLGRDATTAQVEAELESQGLRAAFIEELLAFGAAHKELQRQFLIVALGARCLIRGLGSVAVLDERGTERALSLYVYGHYWDRHCRFAAVRKS